ncbi:hypothetical protein KA005_39125, partial [bacterium]|nr:hypothetical protein [bacterium]
ASLLRIMHLLTIAMNSLILVNRNLLYTHFINSKILYHNSLKTGRIDTDSRIFNYNYDFDS